MARRKKRTGGAARWGGLAALGLALLLLARAAAMLPEDARSLGTRPSPLPTETAPPVTPTQPSGDAERPVEAGIVFGEWKQQSPEPAQPAGTAPPEQRNEWTYSNSKAQVTITRHEEGSFVYFAADVQLTRPGQFWYAFSNERYGAGAEALSDIAQRHNPILAVNGDYYGFHDNGVIIRGGELFRRQNSSRALLIVDAKGDLRVLTDRSEAQSRVASRLMDEGVLHTFEFGPVLVDGGEAVPLKSVILRVTDDHLEPRTAIGQLGPLHYLVIVVDGRSEGYSEGCSLSALQGLFLDRGAQVAFNLDGGGSTTLWFEGEIINRPAAGGERKVSDIVMFLRD